MEGAITIHHRQGWEVPAANALRLARKETPRLAARLGIPFTGHYRIHLARGEKQLPARLAALMPRWAVGLTLPFEARVILRLDRLNSNTYPGNFREVLTHELVHLVMGAVGRERFRGMPWWFHEGTAQVLSSHAVFIKQADLGELARGRGLRDLSRLGIEESRSRRGTDLAYQEAHSFADFLRRRFGDRVFARVIAHTGEGLDFNLAFIRATGFSYVTLEEQWKAFLSSHPRATILHLAREFFWVLLILAFPLFVLAVARRRNRDIELQKSWEAESVQPPDQDPDAMRPR